MPAPAVATLSILSVAHGSTRQCCAGVSVATLPFVEGLTACHPAQCCGGSRCARVAPDAGMHRLHVAQRIWKPQVVSREHVRMSVWERGAGRTLACGTGVVCHLLPYELLCVCTPPTATADGLRGQGGFVQLAHPAAVAVPVTNHACCLSHDVPAGLARRCFPVPCVKHFSVRVQAPARWWSPVCWKAAQSAARGWTCLAAPCRCGSRADLSS